ncbi:Protein embryonic gonad [Toxocara canis]|uniref:Protein embryonic gonad n=1 Tax=Toxocara canis TaxID=6265 RepID=A0A0B2W0H8_TOXCA|nr:Protein embryonic gonad [Toxocara canis]
MIWPLSSTQSDMNAIAVGRTDERDKPSAKCHETARRMLQTGLCASHVTFMCQVCNEIARGYHFGAFTCEGCKSFFGRTCKPSKSDSERRGEHGSGPLLSKIKLQCKSGGNCNVQGRNRTSCKFCRFNKCIAVGMAPQNSRYGRRSKYFKVSSVLDAQEKARISNPPAPAPPSLQLAKPVPLPFWSLPIWISQDAVLKQQSFSVNDSDPVKTEDEILPQTEPLDLSLKKTSV